MNTEKWTKIPNEDVINITMENLKLHNMNVILVNNKKDAFEKVMQLIPKDSEVMDLTSVTLDQIGISKEIQESGKYNSVRKKIMSVNQEDIRDAMRRNFGAVDYAVGSVHAITQDGKILIASNSGSQLPAYAFGAKNLIWVVGAQKIVENLDEAFKRIQEHSFPLEDERARKVYGMPSGVNKILIVEKEIMPNRITIILVKEILGF